MAAITRRTALTTGLFGAAAASCSRPAQRSPFNSSRAAADGMFAHGVASGDPGADSLVIWTRISVAGEEPVRVVWEVARDADFSDMLAKGETDASSGGDWTVKAVPSGLPDGERVFYRFIIGEDVSPVGAGRTLPAGGVDRARFAVLSCSNYPFGLFNVYDQIARRDDLDAVLHLGDYFYEYGREGYGGEEGAALGRQHEPAHECVTLADYRARHAQYKSDPCLQAAHGAHAFITIWDDHETANNSWSGGAENHDPASEGLWDDRRRAALQAYYEWMPIRDPEPASRAKQFSDRSHLVISSQSPQSKHACWPAPNSSNTTKLLRASIPRKT